MTTLVDELILNERRYISAKRAAEICSYAQDYIGQLCREGKIGAVRVGRNWYVEEASIVGHKQYSNTINSKEGVLLGGIKNSIMPAKHLKKAFAVYSSDDSPLFPNLDPVSAEEQITKIPIRIVVEEENGSIVQRSAMDIDNIPQKYTLKVTQSLFDRVLGLTVIVAVLAMVITSGVLMSNSDTFVGHINTAQSAVVQATDTFVGSSSSIAPEIVDTYRLVAKEVYESVNLAVYTIYTRGF